MVVVTWSADGELHSCNRYKRTQMLNESSMLLAVKESITLFQEKNILTDFFKIYGYIRLLGQLNKISLLLLIDVSGEIWLKLAPQVQGG